MQSRRMIRLLRLLQELGGLKWHAIPALCRRYEVDPRTLTRDVQYLRKLGFGVQRDDNHLRLTPMARTRLRGVMLNESGAD